MTTITPELLTVPEVMTQLKVGRSKVYELIRTRRLASLKIDGARRIPADSVRDFIQNQLAEAA
ncbi:MAG: helix-turn-helix domain-containing protein [Streptomyces sp.]|nr:helix-turn-helix domain-containing protein [Streptomyces sp.]NUP41974.1 helix-turn-helix domain-containing protein [Streptomyces sp.]